MPGLVHYLSSLFVLHSVLVIVQSVDMVNDGSLTRQAIRPIIPFTDMHPIDVCLFACNLCYDVVSNELSLSTENRVFLICLSAVFCF